MQGLIEIAWLACPLTAINNGQCYSGQDTGQWNYSITTTVQLHISEYLGTAVYNIPNGTIENVEVSTDPVAFDYPASDLQKIYSVALNGTLTESTIEQELYSVRGMLLFYLASVIAGTSGAGRQTGFEHELFRNFLALPLYAVNYNKLRLPSEPIPENLRNTITTGYFGTILYRLVIRWYSLYTFTILGAIVIAWYSGIFIYCLMATYLAPNISEYPEIDFASKSIRTAVVNGAGNDMADVLEGLGNANSSDIEEKVKGKRFFVRAAKPAGSDLERVVFTTNDDGLDFLNPGRRYL